MVKWGTPVEIERRNRIRLTLWAYAYERMDESLVPDHVFDEVSKQIDTSVDTGHPVLDKFFRYHFDPSTGMWINKHPDIGSVHMMYVRHHRTLT